MRKSWKIMLALACLTLVGAPAFSAPVFADTSNPQDASVADPNHGQGDIPGLRPGADPTDPSTNPFLPDGKAAPQAGPRSHSPLAIGTDLALNLPYTIAAKFPDARYQAIESRNYPDRGQLTNGKFASQSFLDPQWTGLLGQYQRDVTVNLGKVENIHAVSLDLLHNAAAGIALPDDVTYFVSQDGVKWEQIGSVAASYQPGDFSIQTDPFELTNVNVNAQYVKAEFTNKVWAFIDQFSVYGYDQPNSAAKTPEGTLPQDAPLGYLTSSSPASGGVKNAMLAYTDGHGDLGTWTKNDFAPMVAHENTDGTPQSWMFDTVLFLPYPNGYFPTTADAWSGYVKNIFTPDIQLSALDQAVGDTKKALNDPNYKEKVILAIPETDSDPSNFGSITPGGPSLDFNSDDVGAHQAYLNKVQAIRWYVNQMMDSWQKADFQNLQLVGFYWFQESLDSTETYDEQLVQDSAKIVHQNNQLLYWIPYYGAIGITQWKQLGFDAVMIQPNVSFSWYSDANQPFQMVSELGKNYGTGVEVEAHWDVTSSDPSLATTSQAKYFDYFSVANVYGFNNNVLLSYYLNSKTLVDAYHMSDPFYHQVYDNTAAFINGKWTGTTIQ